VDDLHVCLVLLSFVVLRHEYDYAVLDEQIAELPLRGVAVPHTQNLGASHGLAAGDVHQCQQLTVEIVDRLHPISQLSLVDPIGCLIAYESPPTFWALLHLLKQPSLSIYGPRCAGVVDETPTVAVVARVVEQILPRYRRHFLLVCCKHDLYQLLSRCPL
jgi:hypothetical protein